MDAITLRGVTKRFKKRTIRDHHTTLKSELIRWLKGQKRQTPPAQHIEALRGVDLSVPKGKTMGIIGRNGSGKSTLLKVITGIYAPTSGTVQVNGRISALLELGAGFHPEFSGRENILINGIILGMSRAEVKARMDEIIAFSELGDFIDEPVRTYSSGMYMRLAFSVATHVDPDILLIDEILAVGDAHFSKKSMAKMNEFKRSGRTIVLVTHDLDAVQKWCDVAAWIDGGRVRLVGEPSQVVDQYRLAVAAAETESSASLKQPGHSLPDLAAPRPIHGVPSDKRSGTYRAEIARVRLLDERGADVSTTTVDAPLQIVFDLIAKEPVRDVDLGVSLLRPDGLVCLAASARADGAPLPDVLVGQATVRLRIDRLGLAPGPYLVDTRVWSGDETYDFQRGLYALRVEGTPNIGVANPPRRWHLAEADAQPAAVLG